MTRVFKILTRAEWRAARRTGRFAGSAVDLRDGYIHLSTADQAQETARRHFQGTKGLVTLEIESDDLGAALRWEPSRGGELFPHIYGDLDVRLVRAMRDAPLGPDGAPVLDLRP